MILTSEQRQHLSQLSLDRPPIAVAFLSTPPQGLPHVDRADAAGCGYWKTASEGHSFYTTASDHVNCPIGAFTHGVTLTPAQSRELEGLVGTMIELKYIESREVPAIPHRTAPLTFVVYAPLDGATFAPDVVIFRGNGRQIMLLTEAARAAGVFEQGSVMGRPACSMLPQTLASGGAVASVGCIGNRVYTELQDNEFYLSVPGASVDRFVGALGQVLAANAALEQFHRGRAAALRS